MRMNTVFNRCNGIWLAIFLTFVILLTVPIAQAKTTSDPNHSGWYLKRGVPFNIDWKPVEAKCENCTRIVAQYNQTIRSLLTTRANVEIYKEFFRQPNGEKTPSTGESAYKNYVSRANEYILSLEQQAQYLQMAIGECEKEVCSKRKKTKIKVLKVSNKESVDTIKPNEVFKTLGVSWPGEYKSNCMPCMEIVSQLNAVPEVLNLAQFNALNAQAEVELFELSHANGDFLNAVYADSNLQKHHENFDALTNKLEQARGQLNSITDLYQKIQIELETCERRFCPAATHSSITANPDGNATQCIVPAAHEPIIVGDNGDVGSSANFKEKAKKKAAGLATKAITGLLGIGGSGGKSDGPVTYKDPVKNSKKLKVKTKQPNREIRVGAVFTEDGLLVSTNIKKMPGTGTFQTAYLENQRGWRLFPIALYMYEIWREWKLSVSWTRDTYVNGQRVNREQGGWTESGRDLLAKGEETIYGQVAEVPIWEQLGFNTAVSGARSIGTLFSISPAMLAEEPINLIVHATSPKEDPVVTIPYLFTLYLDAKGSVVVESVEKTMAAVGKPCDSQDIDVINTNNPTNENTGDLNSTLGDSSVNDSPVDQNDDETESNSNNSLADTKLQPPVEDSDQPGSGLINADQGKDKKGSDENERVVSSSTKSKDPCKEECKELLKIAKDKEAAAKKAQSAADAAKKAVIDADNAAEEAERLADQAEEMAKDIPRSDHAIINGHKYTTADTEYRIKLQAEINQAHKEGRISDKEHELQTKANTVKHAQQERLKNLAKLRKQAELARAQAEVARQAANEAKEVADKAQTKSDDAKAEAITARKAYNDCVKKAKEACEKEKAAEAKRIAEAKAAEEKRQAEIKRAEDLRIAEEKRKADAERRKKTELEEEKRLLALIKKLGLIDKRLAEVPGIWEVIPLLPDFLETPVGMLGEQISGVPIPTDTLKALGGLYGLLGAMLNPCTKAGIQKTETRLRGMINQKTGKNYTEGEAERERAAMCSLMGKIRGRLAALKNRATTN